MVKASFGGNLRVAVAFAAIAACALSSGCRRTDVRDFEVSIPALSADNESAIRQSLAMFGGIDKSSLRFDRASRKLFLRYDSMQLAKKNIEMAIAKAGFEANGVKPESIGVGK